MTEKTPFRVVLVEDSPTVQVALRGMLEEMGFQVVGTASSVHEAESLVRSHRPQLMLSDVQLSDGDGIGLTQKIMSTTPVPIVLMTAHDPTSPDLAFRAMQAGALEVLAKPPGRGDPAFGTYFQQCARTLRNLAGIPVVRRRITTTSTNRSHRQPWTSAVDIPIITIGASTGGPTLIAEMLKALDGQTIQFCVVAQHMVPDFIGSFRDWLQPMVKRPIHFAAQGMRPERGAIYLIPPKCHLELSAGGCWNLPQGVTSTHVPSIDVLFRSLSSELAHQVVAVLLTGMGQDGAAGLKALKTAGAYTIVQDPSTALLYSMPQSAIRLDAACSVMPAPEIADWLRRPGWLKP